MKKKRPIEWYLEYLNDFVTVARMAEYYGMDEMELENLIDLGRAEYNRRERILVRMDLASRMHSHVLAFPN